MPASTRLTFILSLLGISATAQTKSKYYITGFGNDCLVPPLVCYGTGRIDALLNAPGITVWTEAEYARFEREAGNQFRLSCAVIERDKQK